MKVANKLFHRASAFTLVELLIYVAIFAVTSGTLTAILLTTTRIQNNEVAGIQVTQELNLVLETTQRLVRDASLIEKVYEGVTETAPCTTFCSVKLRMQNTALDPTVIRSTATAIYLKQGVNPETTITSNRVIVNSLNFTKFDIIGGHATIQIDASLTYNSTNPQLAITKTLRSAVGRVSAATFDSDLLPDATTSNRNIGAATNLWQNLSISKLFNLGTNTTDILSPAPTAGSLYYNTTTGNERLRVYNGATWKDIGSQTPWTQPVNAKNNALFGNDIASGTLTLDSTSDVTKGNIILNPTGGNVGIGTGTNTPGEKLEVIGNIISKGTSWTSRTSAADISWRAVTYGNGLFVATAKTGVGNRVMTSPDGITWTSRTSAADIEWQSITYGGGMFVAMAATGAGESRAMTSPDGINWTLRTTPPDTGALNDWNGIAYGNGLFVAVSTTGTATDRVITSPDGINWTQRVSAAGNDWHEVTYGNGLFVATGNNIAGSGVMTSPDGITWTSRTSPTTNSFQGVTYGNGLFVAVSTNGTGDRVMTSPDGITWTSRTSAADNAWEFVTYGNGLFVAVAFSGVGNRVMTSPDGITWTLRASAADNDWHGVAYGNGVFVAVGMTGGTSHVMTSGKPDTIPFSANNIYQGGMSVFGSVGIGTTTPQGKLDINGSLAVGGSQGTVNQVLTSQGPGVAPIWNTPSAGGFTAMNAGTVDAGFFDCGAHTETITHGLGKTPALIRITAHAVNGGYTYNNLMYSFGTYRVSSAAHNYIYESGRQTGSSLSGSGSGNIIFLREDGTLQTTATVSSVNSTNFVLSVSSNKIWMTGCAILWEVEG